MSETPAEYNASPVPAPAAEAHVPVVEPASIPGVLSGRIVDEALVQLRKLGELREQELKRHELVIAEMREHVQRHAKNNRLLVVLGLGALALIAALAGVLYQLRDEQQRTRTEVSLAAGAVAQMRASVQDATVKQETGLNGLAQGVNTTAQKLDAVYAGVSAKVDDGLNGLRAEREAIQTGIRVALDDQRRQMIDREVALRNEEQRLRQEMERVREARQKIIQEAIDKLSTLSQQAPAAGP